MFGPGLSWDEIRDINPNLRHTIRGVGGETGKSDMLSWFQLTLHIDNFNEF